MIEQHPISDSGETPSFEQIVFGMITVFGRGNQIFFNFKNPGNKFKFKGKTEAALLTFLKRLETMRISPMRGPDKATSAMTPLDLNVDIASAVVLAVPPDSNMQFSVSSPAVTRKAEQTDGHYRNLRYVRFSAGATPKFEKAPFEGCKTVVFFATQPPEVPKGSKGYSHGFNMHIDIIQQSSDGKRQVLPVIIDPDVRNPGGGGG